MNRAMPVFQDGKCGYPVAREVSFTQEVLFIKRGRLRVDFYDPAQQYLESRILTAGDVILLATGDHGFEVLDEIELIEVKQGPYAGDADKTRFVGITAAGRGNPSEKGIGGYRQGKTDVRWPHVSCLWSEANLC